MDTASPVVNDVSSLDADPAFVSKLQPLVNTPTTPSDLNSAIEGQPTYQTNAAKPNATSPILRTRTLAPNDNYNLPDDDGPISTSTTKSTRARKPSVTDALLGGAASVVAAARRLVLHDEEDELDGGENLKAGHTATNASSGDGILPSFLVPDATDHHGLEFSQRRLSVHHKKTSEHGSSSSLSSGALKGSETGVASSRGPVPKSGSGSGSGAGSVSGAGLASTAGSAFGAGSVEGIGSASSVGPASGACSVPGTGMESGEGLASGAGPVSDAGSGSDERLASSKGLASAAGLAAGVVLGSDIGSGLGPEPGSGSVPKSDIDDGSRIVGGLQKQSSQSEIAAGHISISGADRVTAGSPGMGQNLNGGPPGGAPAGAGPLSSNSSSNAPKTMYVASRDPNSARQQGMNVDQPAVSRTNVSTSRSSMGVDVPRMVGNTQDSRSGRRGSRSSGLNVDGKSALSDHPPEGDELHIQDHSGIFQNTATGIPTATGTITTGPGKNGGEKMNGGHYRKPAASGLNVDSRNTKSSAVGPTTLDHGIEVTKSAYHVDKAGATDRTRTGMNVDGLATSSVHLAEAAVHNDSAPVPVQDTVNASGGRRGSDRSSIYDKVKNAFRRHGDDTGAIHSGEVEIASAGIAGASSVPGEDMMMNVNSIKGKETSNVSQTSAMENGRHLNTNSQAYSNEGSSDFSMQGSSTSSSREGGRIVSDVPAGYDGPLPQVAPGEDVVWVKHIIQTDYYDDAVEDEQPVVSGRRGSLGSFLDRIRGEAHHQDVEKGKGRV